MNTRCFTLRRTAAILLLAMIGHASTFATEQRELATNSTFVFFDVETTGFSPEQDRIVELAAVKMTHGQITESRVWLIDPGRPIPDRVQQVHGITTEMVEEAQPFSARYPDFATFSQGAILVAHNASFDTRFMRAEMLRNGFEPSGQPVIDSLHLFRAWYPELASHTLEALVEHAQIETTRFHRAEDDAMYVALLLQKALQENNALTLEDLYQASDGPMTL